MKAILLARVSSIDQEDGHSISAQEHRLSEYAVKKGFDVDHIFSITESSTKETRKQFEAILVLIKKTKEPVALIVETIDRLQRSFKESIILTDLMREGKLELHFIREGLIINKDSNSSDLMRWDMGVMFARGYVLQLSDNVKRSQDEKLRKGEWPALAPLGYLNVTREDGTHWIDIDHEKGHFIRKIYEWYAEENISMFNISKKCNKMGMRSLRGKKVSSSVIGRVLTNIFYHGKMEWKGQIWDHCYEPIVSVELFEKARAVREGWKKKPFQFAAKPFAFRGIITCIGCGSTISPELQKKKYIYYSCATKTCGLKSNYVREKALIEQVEEVFQSLVIPDNYIEEILATMRSVSVSEAAYHKSAMTHLRKEYDRIEERIVKMYDEKLDGSITQDFYDKKLKEYKGRQSEIQQSEREHSNADKDFWITASQVLDLGKRAYDIFQSSETPEKRQLLQFLFQNCQLDGKKLIYQLKEPFDMISQHSSTNEWGG